MSYFLWQKHESRFLVFKTGPQWCLPSVCSAGQLPGVRRGGEAPQWLFTQRATVRCPLCCVLMKAASPAEMGPEHETALGGQNHGSAAEPHVHKLLEEAASGVPAVPLALGPSVLLLISRCKQMIQLGAEVKDSSESEKPLPKARVPAPWARLRLVVSGGAPQPAGGRLRLGFTGPKRRAKASSTGN